MIVRKDRPGLSFILTALAYALAGSLALIPLAIGFWFSYQPSIHRSRAIYDFEEIKPSPTPTSTHTPTPTPTPTITPTSTPAPTATSTPPFTWDYFTDPNDLANEGFWLDVDLSEQKVRAYDGATLLRTFTVSTGRSSTPTLTGAFRVWIKYRFDDMRGPGYFLEDVPYTMYFYRGYGVHGTYWHSNFGTPMSHGCVNMETSEAQWVIERSTVGTLVNVHP